MANEWLDVGDITPRISYVATGGQTAFAVPFVFFDEASLNVYKNGILLTLAVDYTISGPTDFPTGTVTLLVGATVGDVVMIVRDVEISQTTHIPPSGPLDIGAVNFQFSKLIAIDQQLQNQTTRTLHLPDSDSTVSGELSSPAVRANKLLGFDNTGAIIYPLGPTFVAGTAIGVVEVDSRATAQVTTIPVSTNIIVTNGYVVPGDGLGGSYKRVVSLAVGVPGFQTADGAWWQQVSGAVGATVTQPQGRLTLTSLTQVTTSDVVGATTLFYTPGSGGNQVPIWNGAIMVPTAFAELSQLTTDATKSPAAVIANSVYDVFVWNDAGTIRGTRGPAWASDTSRGTGAGTSEIQLLNGVWTNKFDITNGPTAGFGTMVGSARADASSQFKDTAAFRWVSNAYNAVSRPLKVTEAASSWVYTSATFRQANGNAANQLDFLQTLGGNQLNAQVVSTFSNTTIGQFGLVAIDIDVLNTTAISNNINNFSYVSVANYIVPTNAIYSGYPGMGRHIAIWKEVSTATGSGTFFSTAGGPVLTSGIYGSIMN
jgi:hypothetical protein